MTIGRNQHTNNIVVGAGEFYLDLLDDAGGLTGERYLGDSIGGSLSITTERTTVFKGDGPVAEQLVDSVRSITRTLTVTLHDISPENLALFVGAPEPSDSAAIAASAVTDEAHTVRPGRWYQLGQSDANPSGVRGVSSVAVNLAASGNAEVAAAGYVVDAAAGRIYFNDGTGQAANIDAAGTAVLIDYTPTAETAGARRQVKARDARQVQAAVRYLEDPSAGEGRNLYARRCNVGAGGEMALKSRDTQQQITVTAQILVPEVAGAAALFIDGEPV